MTTKEKRKVLMQITAKLEEYFSSLRKGQHPHPWYLCKNRQDEIANLKAKLSMLEDWIVNEELHIEREARRKRGETQ